jgi:organic radical activating enzyme
LLQLDQQLIDELHNHNFEVAIETNGTILPPNNIDWVCVSPKKNADLVLKSGDELKLVYPQKNFNPKQFESLDFTYFSIQPMDGKQLQKNILKCVSYCMENPVWRLSLQTHKIIGVR